MGLREEFHNPPAKYRIKPFWFWNGTITKEEITHQIEEMQDKGLGGVFICARQGMTVPYLSREWFELVSHAVEEAKRCNLEAWLYDEYPYPSGMSGGEVLLEHPEAEHTVLKHRTLWAAGETEIEEQLEWGRILHARAYPVSGGITDWKQGIDLAGSIGTLQTEKIYQQTGLTRYNRKRFFSYQPCKVLRDRLPKGEWRIELYWETVLGDFKYYGGFLDPCNKAAVKTFLDTTHERYQKALGDQFGSSIYGMFSDEVGLLSPIPWSRQLPKAFMDRNGYSLLEALPALHDASIEGADRIRYDLYQTAHELFTGSYHEQVSSWCREHHLSYATEVPSMRMSTQRYSDIVGGDTAHEKLGKPLEWIYDEYIGNYRSNAKAVSSLARQLGKPYAMIESFHSVGWSMTLQDAKWMIDRLGSSGINFYNFHAFYYTIQDITKHDAPPSQFLQNPYWKHYRKLADYVGRMGAFVSQTEADISIAVLDPTSALWTRLGNPFHGFSYQGESEEEKSVCDYLRNQWILVCKTILFHQMDYDHLDAELLMDAQVCDGKLLLGRAAYSVVVLPPCHCMEEGARKKLEEFTAAGGHVIGLKMLPHISIGHESDEETKAAWKRLFQGSQATFLDRTSWEETLVAALKSRMRESVEVTLLSGNAKQLIVARRVDAQGVPYVFLVNQGNEDMRIQMIGDFSKSAWYDLETGAITRTAGTVKGLTVVLTAFESRLLRQEELDCAGEKEKEKTVIRLPMKGEWRVTPEGKNICRFADCMISLDGASWKKTESKTFMEQCKESGIITNDMLIYKGDFGVPGSLKPNYPLSCWYQMKFYGKIIPKDLSLLMDRETIAGDYQLFINGCEVEKDRAVSVRHHDQNNVCIPIASLAKEGENTIQVKSVIAKDEEGLRDPLYLMGTFGVTQTDTAGEMMPCLIHQPEYVEPDGHWYRGFPYYSGTLVFASPFQGEMFATEDSEPFSLELGYEIPTYDCLEVRINGKSLGVKSYAPYRWTCSKENILAGENQVEIRVTNTLANLLDGTYFDYETHQLVSIEPELWKEPDL